ncbi:hypothetical protein Tco_1323420 [Tanacetum coccineum]
MHIAIIMIKMKGGKVKAFLRCYAPFIRESGSLRHYFDKFREELRKIAKGKKPHKTAYARLLYKAAHGGGKLINQYKSTEPKDLWMETYHAVAATWQPCADQRVWKPSGEW